MNGLSRGINSTPPVLKNIIIINILLFLATEVLTKFGVNLTQYLALYYPGSEYFRPHQLITHMFMHAGWAHLFFNMFGLWMFGKILEQVWGSKRFMIYFFATGLGAAALHLLVNYFMISHAMGEYKAMLNTLSPETFDAFIRSNFSEYYGALNQELTDKWYSNPGSAQLAADAQGVAKLLMDRMINIPTVGASGAVFGVLLGFGMLFPNTEIMLLFPPIPMKAKYFVMGYGAIELYLGISQPGSNVAHFAHLGGMIFGFLLIKYWNKKTTTFY
ncbi:rhomboid family intramembrane serine protease [Williamwhitmania taraxaci]|uniref:Rhomboid family protein n=1 Tax=Williamwhitmania taraxaci TaxID=1640674 RepID=A0A1G6KSM2_9BACT|nr:rhomboid family intramembrane serine protease [Williamwhitmania taraxaci]SDC33515.1 Rhomboid family protein [Williamwhitmania taraxaci]